MISLELILVSCLQVKILRGSCHLHPDHGRLTISLCCIPSSRTEHFMQHSFLVWKSHKTLDNVDESHEPLATLSASTIGPLLPHEDDLTAW